MLVEKKFDIENKLKKEQDNLAAIRIAANRSSTLASDVCDVLGACTNRLQQLEMAVLPLYGDTARLQRVHENMEKTTKALDNVINYYMIVRELADIITAGPNTTTTDTLNTYLEALDKLAEAQNYFVKNNPQSIELENINSLYDKGVAKLESSFEDILARNTRPLSPTTLLDMIAVEEDSSVESVSVSGGGSTTSSGLETMRAMAAWLSAANRAPSVPLQAIRAPAAKSSLTHFRDFLRTRSMGSSPLMRARNALNRSDSSVKKMRIHKALEKKANKMLMKASQTLEMSTGLAIGPRRALTDSYTEESECEDCDIESVGELAAALCRIARAEQRQLLGLVPLPRLPALLTSILQECFVMLANDVEKVVSWCRRAALRCSGGAGAGWALVARLHALAPDFERALAPASHQPYLTVVHNAQHNMVRSLDEWVDGLKADSGSAPVDGTVHQLAAITLTHLNTLAEHVHTIGPALGQEPAYARAVAPLTLVQDRNGALLAVYMRKVLAQLNLALRSNSEHYPEALKAIFRLNNTHYLLQGLQRTGLLEVLMIAEPECETNYRDMIQEFRTAYLNSWNKLLVHTELDEALPAKLRDRDRQVIKDKFSSFNRELEECVRAQRGYSVPDSELRESVRRDAKQLLLPRYAAFHDRHAPLPFTKSPHKYLKYDSVQVSVQLDSLFDETA